jgi:hypothetical protein
MPGSSSTKTTAKVMLKLSTDRGGERQTAAQVVIHFRSGNNGMDDLTQLKCISADSGKSNEIIVGQSLYHKEPSFCDLSDGV